MTRIVRCVGGPPVHSCRSFISNPRAWVLAVVEDDDVGVIGVDDDALMRTPRSTVASGAFVISVTGSSSR